MDVASQRCRHVDVSGAKSLRPALTVWAAWTVLMTGTNLATPLYGVYAARFGFSSLVLTAIFATYAFVLVPALVLFGRLSDRFGRRPVMVSGLVVACAALAVFASAQSPAWLFAARALQGLGVGMISGAATAALVELDPVRDRRRAALLAGLAQAGGSAAGPLLAGVLVQWAPAPRALSYLVGLGATVVAAGFVLALGEETGPDREPWRIQLPRVPASIRGAFARVSLTGGLVWASVALYLSIVPSYAAHLLRTHNLALLSAVAATALTSSCVTQLVANRRRASVRLDQAVGLGILAVGLLLLVLASPLHSLALLLLGALAVGSGHGLCVLNAQEELNGIAPADRRGEVTAAFVSCIYFVVAVSVISAGLLDRGLSLALSVDIVAAVLAVLAVAAAVWQAASR